MKLSAKMPAQMDSTLPATQDASMPSDSQMTGDNGPMNGPSTPISRESAPQEAQWENLNEVGSDWQTEDKKTGSEWELSDRVEGNKGSVPQRKN